MPSLDDEMKRTEWMVHPERVRALREMEAKRAADGPWWAAIGPVLLALVVITILCALYASVMML